jgi:predicted nucleic acid-binding protein
VGLKYLLDTNIVIYHLSGMLDERTAGVFERFFEDEVPAVSAVTEIELFGWHNASDDDILKISTFLELCDKLEIGRPVIDLASLIRRKYRLKLGDAVIAASAITHSLILVSRNEGDFKRVEERRLLNPWNQIDS